MAILTLLRDARLFMRRPELRDAWREERAEMELAADELVHPEAPADYVLRLGRIRLTEFLADGREICRAVLQAGSCFVVRDGAAGAAPGDAFPLEMTTLMALGDAELWRLPAGALAERDVD